MVTINTADRGSAVLPAHQICGIKKKVISLEGTLEQTAYTLYEGEKH
jgi:hypothetical protein